MSALYIVTKLIKDKFGHTIRKMRPAIPLLVLAAHLHVCVHACARVCVCHSVSVFVFFL